MITSTDQVLLHSILFFVQPQIIKNLPSHFHSWMFEMKVLPLLSLPRLNHRHTCTSFINPHNQWLSSGGVFLARVHCSHIGTMRTRTKNITFRNKITHHLSALISREQHCTKWHYIIIVRVEDTRTAMLGILERPRTHCLISINSSLSLNTQSPESQYLLSWVSTLALKLTSVFL